MVRAGSYLYAVRAPMVRWRMDAVTILPLRASGQYQIGYAYVAGDEFKGGYEMTVEEIDVLIEKNKKKIADLKKEMYKAIFSLILIIVGFVLLFIFGGWKIGIAMLIIGWGNNIAYDGLYKKK
jgi:hypothetical protein